MPRPDRTRSLDEQVAEYRKQFELYAVVKRETEDLEATLMDPMARYREIARIRRRAQDLGWDGSMWNWDEEWDGVLVANCYKLEAAGFIVTQFYRKRKIMFKLPPKQLMTRREIANRVFDALGDKIDGIGFAKGVSVWWGAISKGRRW